jgi:hypothetical protein
MPDAHSANPGARRHGEPTKQAGEKKETPKRD